MNAKPGRRSSLFLLELMIAIFFFILASAICLQFFVKSHMLEAESNNLNHAVHAATSVAEVLRSEEDALSLLQTVYPQGHFSETVSEIYFQSDWEACDAAHAAYTLVLETSVEDGFLNGQIDIFKNETTLYSLEILKYWNEEGLYEN